MGFIRRGRALLLACLLAACSGCWNRAAEEVVVYAALDREFSEPILADFERESGVRVAAKYDVESTKTVGLVNALIQERRRPRCDLFWNNEILHTLRLEKQGLADVYVSPAAKDFPKAYRSPEGRWVGFAARARVLVVNTDLVPPDERPKSITDLADPRWKGKVGLAKPLFGTTATHAAVLFSAWGDERAEKFFSDLADNAQIMSGNKQVALAVGKGQLAFGLTDTDDAIIELEAGRPIEIVFPDQGQDALGTLFIPNTLCVIKGGPNSKNARRLVDYLLAPAVEKRLADGESAQFPVNPAVKTPPRFKTSDPIRWMDVDFAAAADKWDHASAFLRETFATGE